MVVTKLTYRLFGIRNGKAVRVQRNSFQSACASMVRLNELGFTVTYEIHEVLTCRALEVAS